MKKTISFLVFALLTTSSVFAQPTNNLFIQDTSTTIVGTGQGGPTPTPTPGPDEPGVFKPPFKCGLSYVGQTYHGHSAYAVDFNRAPYGADDRGDPVRAVADGEVVWDDKKYCGQVSIHHKGGYFSTYVHMRNISVHMNQTVRAGEKIGEISNTSYPPFGCTAYGSHLHLEFAQGKVYDTIKLALNNKPYPESLENPPVGYNVPLGSRLGPRVNGTCP